MSMKTQRNQTTFASHSLHPSLLLSLSCHPILLPLMCQVSNIRLSKHWRLSINAVWRLGISVMLETQSHHFLWQCSRDWTYFTAFGVFHSDSGSLLRTLDGLLHHARRIVLHPCPRSVCSITLWISERSRQLV